MSEYRVIHQEPNYTISKDGSVTNIKTNHVKSTRLDKDGYPRVTLYPSGKTYTIHRLIMTNFYDKEDWSEQVNHIDNNVSNSVYSNLEWVTAKQNIEHVHKQNRNADVSGSKNPMSKLTEDDAWNIKYQLDDLGVVFVAQLYGVAHSTISNIRNNVTWVDL